MRTTGRLFTLLGALLLVLAPTQAGAWKVFQGKDYTATVNQKKGFKVCDKEADGRPVRGKARDARGHEERETDGGDAGCDKRSNPPDMGLVDEMETCEIINNWPDACSGWYDAPGNG